MKQKENSFRFQYIEDHQFFCAHLAEGDSKVFERDFTQLFDFSSPVEKRREFNRKKKQLLNELFERDGKICRLKLHEDCSKEDEWEPDHIVPLSSNNLNKKIRKIPRVGKAKVISQSFGSNHLDNLTLACRRCNAAKKNLLMPDILSGHANRLRKFRASSNR